MRHFLFFLFFVRILGFVFAENLWVLSFSMQTPCRKNNLEMEKDELEDEKDDEEDAAAALAKEERSMSPLEEEHSSSDCEFLDGMDKNIRYRCEWMFFNKVTMGKPPSMRTLKNSGLARERFMRKRQPPPLQTSLHAASSCSSTPEAKRRRGHVGGDTEERTTKRTRSCHVHD